MAGEAGPADKLPWVGTTIFTVMSQLAEQHGAVNLGQGYPDFPPPAALVEAVARHMRAGRNQYAPMAGLPSLRDQIARKLAVTQGVAVDPVDEITGQQQRLKNLGYPIPMVNGKLDKATRAAILAFQKVWKLKETGEGDEATKAKLLELHP